FHVARDVRRLVRDHKSYPSIRKQLADYDWEGLMVELNSAGGTLEKERKEERLEELITQPAQQPAALGDYREQWNENGIETDEVRPMGSAEGTMSVFARRLKNGRSWCTEGLDKFIDIMVALKDNLEIKTLHGILEHSLEQQEKEKPPKHFVEKITNSAA